MVVPLSVRKAGVDDAFGIFKLAVSMHRETDFRFFAFDPEKAFKNLHQWLGGDSQVMFVAEKAGELIGFMAGNVEYTWFSHDPFASEKLFFVLPEHRGSRAAYMMFRAFVQWAQDKKTLHLSAGVATGSGPAAERLYAKFGMKHMGGNFIRHFSEEQPHGDL